MEGAPLVFFWVKSKEDAGNIYGLQLVYLHPKTRDPRSGGMASLEQKQKGAWF